MKNSQQNQKFRNIESCHIFLIRGNLERHALRNQRNSFLHHLVNYLVNKTLTKIRLSFDSKTRRAD